VGDEVAKKKKKNPLLSNKDTKHYS